MIFDNKIIAILSFKFSNQDLNGKLLWMYIWIDFVTVCLWGFVFLRLKKILCVCMCVCQWFSTFIMLCHLNTVLHAVVTPTTKLLSLQLCNCNFAAVLNCNVNICYAGFLICHLCETVMQSSKGIMTSLCACSAHRYQKRASCPGATKLRLSERLICVLK